MPDAEPRKAYALRVQYNPLGSSTRENLFIISAFTTRPAPKRCEAGCPSSATCDATEGRCRCRDGFAISFEAGELACEEVLIIDLPMKCVDVRGQFCTKQVDGTFGLR